MHPRYIALLLAIVSGYHRATVPQMRFYNNIYMYYLRSHRDSPVNFSFESWVNKVEPDELMSLGMPEHDVMELFM